MDVLNGLFTRLLVPGFVINSLPKAGTHLLAKAMRLFPGVRYSGVQFDYSHIAGLVAQNDPGGATLPVGVDWPQPVPVDAVRRALGRVKRGQFTVWHVPFSTTMAGLVTQRYMRSLVMLRDPRDVVISHARFVATVPTHFLYAHYQSLSESERILASIVGVEASGPGQPGLLDIGARCQSVWEWHDQPFNYTTSFEKIVGPQGGGRRETQIDELARIAQHVGLRHTPARLARIADQVFGGTKTFRQGTSGTWAAKFNDEHRRAFKTVAGDLLIAFGYEQDHDW